MTVRLIASKLLHFARERKVYYRMDPRTTTAVETMRIWQMRGVKPALAFLASNYASSLISAPLPREVDTAFRHLLHQFQDR